MFLFEPSARRLFNQRLKDEKFKNFEVNHAKKIYDENTGLIGNEEGSGYNAIWYFCKE